ncbi:MAG: VIT domain-containing protein, partial [Rhodospirillales bacterium]
MPATHIEDVAQGSLLFRAGDAALLLAPTVATDVDISVGGLVARARVSQKFRNPSEDWVEGIYVFPLPENAAVDHLTVRIGERIIEGRIKEREEARRIYEAAKRQGKKAGLLEGQRPNIFTASVANIGPKEEIAVTIEYQQTLRYEQGAFRLRFPMVVGPRYIPGKVRIATVSASGWSAPTDQVPDAENITPPVLPNGLGNVEAVRLAVELSPGFALGELESPYHEIAVTERDGALYRVTLKDGQIPADHDFELVWKPEIGAAPAAGLFFELQEDEPYLLVMVMPPTAEAGEGQARPLPREVIFVIDTSGSMAGASIAQAKAALILALDRLGPGDRFNIVRFNNTAFALFPDARPADRETRALARHLVRGLKAEGGTEMAPAIRLALEGSPPRGYIRQVVFLTDGAVGNERELFGIIHERLGGGRLFTIAIGSAPNSFFMAKA